MDSTTKQTLPTQTDNTNSIPLTPLQEKIKLWRQETGYDNYTPEQLEQQHKEWVDALKEFRQRNSNTSDNALSRAMPHKKNKLHYDIIMKLHEIYNSKNSDYGDSFGETYRKLGIISALTRISDKYNRLISLATKPEEERKVKDESIQDTLLDMANYCIMTVIEMENNND